MSDTALTPDEIRSLLRECVTVVAPGETLIIQVPLDWDMAQVAEYGQRANEQLEAIGAPFRALIVPADALGAAAGPSLPERVRQMATKDHGRG